MNKDIIKVSQTLSDFGINDMNEINDIPIDNISAKILSGISSYSNYFLSLLDKNPPLNYEITKYDIDFFSTYSDTEILDIMLICDWLAFEYLVKISARYFSMYRLQNLSEDDMNKFFNLKKQEN